MTPVRRHVAPERGSVLIVVTIILAALLAGGGVALYVQLANTRSSGLVRFARASLYCTEGGLAATRQVIMTHYADWNAILDPSLPDPGWYPMNDTDGDGAVDTAGVMGEAGDDNDGNDWIVWLTDNEDELATANDPAVDADQRVFVHARCLMHPEQPREVLELVQHKGGGFIYRAQSGQGSGNTGNTNL